MKKAIKIALIILASLAVLVVGGYFFLVSLFTGGTYDGGTCTEPAEPYATQAGVLVYSKEYQLQGDPGEGLADDTAAQYLYDMIRNHFPGEDIHLTLTGLGNTPTGEAYLFAGPIDTTYAVVYGNSDLYLESGENGEWVAFAMDKAQAEHIVMEATKAEAQEIGGEPVYVFKGEGDLNDKKAWFFDMGMGSAKEFTAVYTFAVDAEGKLFGKDMFGKWQPFTAG